MDDGLEARITRFAGDHPGLVVSGLIFALVLSQVMFVARLNLSTALAIASSIGTVDVAMGVLVGSYQQVILIVLLGTDIWRRSAGYSKKPTGWLIRLELVWSVVAVVFVGWLAVISLGVLLLVSNLGDNWLQRRRGVSREPWPAGGSLVFMVILFFVLFPTGWLPVETIEVSDSDDRIVGYVLDADGLWTTVLRDDDRSVVRIRSEAVTARTVCQPPLRPVTPSLIGLLLDPSEPPPCSEAT